MTDNKNLPEITRDQIEAWTDPRSLQRGTRYFEHGHILAPRRQERTLKAECIGSQPTPYRVQITLNERGIQAGDCSCPVGVGGHCKHAVALLLTWQTEPTRFTETEAVETVLARMDRDELVALIEEMLRRHPELESLLTMETLSQAAATQVLDPGPIQEQVTRALFGHGYEWDSGYDIAADLDQIVEFGDSFADREEWANAATVYRTVALTVLDAYDQIRDDEGATLWSVTTCAEGLGRCLEDVADAEMRREILRALFDILCWDTDQGGYGVGDTIPIILEEATTAAERREMAGWVREKLPEPDSDGGIGRDWRRTAYGGILLMLENDDLDDESYLAICRQTGRQSDLVERLLTLDRIDEAVAAAQQATDYVLLDLASRIEAHGHTARALALVQERAAQSKDSRLPEWLKRYAERHDDVETALQIAEEMFWTRPDLTAFVEARRLAEQAGRWPDLRADILNRLAADGQEALLVQIHLEAGDGDAALAAYMALSERLAAAAETSPWRRRRPHQLQLPVARAVKETQPWTAVGLYMEVVEELIGRRGRGNYAPAAQHLQTVREIYADHGEGGIARWTTLIQELKERHRRLPALQDELRKAGL